MSHFNEVGLNKFFVSTVWANSKETGIIHPVTVATSSDFINHGVITAIAVNFLHVLGMVIFPANLFAGLWAYTAKIVMPPAITIYPHTNKIERFFRYRRRFWITLAVNNRCVRKKHSLFCTPCIGFVQKYFPIIMGFFQLER